MKGHTLLSWQVLMQQNWHVHVYQTKQARASSEPQCLLQTLQLAQTNTCNEAAMRAQVCVRLA